MALVSVFATINWQRLDRELTRDNLLFPYAHLIIHQPMLLHGVAGFDECVAHLLEVAVFYQTLRWLRALTRVDQLPKHLLLALQCREPAIIKLFPHLEAFSMRVLFITD